MGGNQDARPFVDLQKDAEEFRQKFDGDIQKCMAFLDGKITTLICDPDSLVSPSKRSTVKQNALVEFSKAKYDIFINVKTLINEMEREWIKYISEMKKLFIENVEIFLAGTKLEVKLPTSEFQTSPGFKKSPRKEKSSITDSLYPIINSFAKNMAALGSPLRNKEANTSRKSTKEIFDDSCLRKDTEITDDESDSEAEPVKEIQSDKLKRGSARVVLLKDAAVKFGEKATPSARNEKESDITASDSESGLNTSRQTRRSRGRQSSEGSLNDSVTKVKSPAGSLKRSDNSDTANDSSDGSSKQRGKRIESKSPSSNERDVSPPSSKSRGGRSRNEAKSSSSQDRDISPRGSRSRGGRSRNETKSSSSQGTTAKRTESKENEKIIEMETTIPSRKSRGRSSQKPIEDKRHTRTAPESTESEENDEIIEMETSRRSRLRNKTPAKQTKSAAPKSSTTTEESEPESSTRSRQKGRTPAKLSKSEKSTTSTEESESESAKEAPRSVTTGRKRRTPAKHNLNNSTIDNDLRFTRSGSVIETPVAPPSPKKSNLVNSHIESERSRSSKKVSFIPSYNISDLDAFTPNVKSKSSIRRKTLLPNLDEIASGADIIPGVPRGRSNKRKTIGGISDLASATPPKRLKVGENKKGVSSNHVDDDTDDNLLESDGDYSDWIPLKRIDGKIPTKPGIYEVKVGRAKKTAYIGHCESLRQKMTLHKLGQNSGHKHLDKFIERNMDDIQIRYEVMSSSDKAKSEVKNKVKNFVSQYKTTPAYN